MKLGSCGFAALGNIAMRLPLAALALAAFGAIGCGRTPPAPPADPKVFHEQMEQLNKDVLRQEGRDKNAPRKRP